MIGPPFSYLKSVFREDLFLYKSSLQEEVGVAVVPGQRGLQGRPRARRVPQLQPHEAGVPVEYIDGNLEEMIRLFVTFLIQGESSPGEPRLS